MAGKVRVSFRVKGKRVSFEKSLKPTKARVGKPKLTAKQKQFLKKDEKQAVRRYNKLGFPNLAKDEAKHLAFISRQKVKPRMGLGKKQPKRIAFLSKRKIGRRK
jgi:hypothetical protein